MSGLVPSTSLGTEGDSCNALIGQGISEAERLFSEPLVLLGQFFPSDNCDPDIHDLRRKVGELFPVLPPRTGHLSYFVPMDLHAASHVFVRVGAHRPPLVRPYKGPF